MLNLFGDPHQLTYFKQNFQQFFIFLAFFTKKKSLILNYKKNKNSWTYNFSQKQSLFILFENKKSTEEKEWCGAHHHHHHDVMTLAFYGSRFIQKKIMRNDETLYIYTSLNPVPNAQVCVYLMVHITKLQSHGPWCLLGHWNARLI
jgi:hypothetical protein